MEDDNYSSTPESTPTRPKRQTAPPGAFSPNPLGGLATPPTTQAAAGAAPGHASAALQASAPLLHHHRVPIGPQTAPTYYSSATPLVTVPPHDPHNPPTTPQHRHFGRGDLSPMDRDIRMGEGGGNPPQASVSNSLPDDTDLEDRYRRETERRREESKRKRAPADVGGPQGSPKPPKKPSGLGPGPIQRKILELEKKLSARDEEEAKRLALMEENIRLLTELNKRQAAELAVSSKTKANPSKKPSTAKTSVASRTKAKSKAGSSAAGGTSRRKAPGTSSNTSGVRNGTGSHTTGAAAAPGGSQASTTNPGSGGGGSTGIDNAIGQGNGEGEDEEQGHEGERKSRYKRQYQLTRDDIPDGAEGIKLAFMFHIRVMWNQVDRRSIPYDPSIEALKSFDERFISEEDLYQQRYAEPLIQAQEVNIQDYRALQRDTKNRNYTRLKLIPDTAIAMMKMTAARYGLKLWAPDLRQAPYGLYNSACRMSAIDSFRQANTGGIYAMFKPDTRFNGNLDLLIKVYDHTVHYLHYRRYLRELALPGANAALDGENTTMQNRRRLAESRALHAKKSGYPRRYLPLFKTKATSDDERDANDLREGLQRVFWIKKRPERSTWANEFYRLFGEEHELFLDLAPNKQRLDRIRRIPPDGMQDNSKFKRLPKKMPLDYYAPAFYNRLPPRLRALIADEDLMVFLPNVKETFQCPDLEELNDEDFMAIPEIAARRSLYNIPDPAVIAQTAAGGDDEDDDDDDEEYDGDNMEVEDEDGDTMDASVALGEEEAAQEGQRRNRLANSAVA
ncbi:hypothetical protein BJ165DRAFT_1534605 [Panaeolus papilionaceus]|nr:hypothetical protein BJ165DRAFT_1534605 [Panaeolus papilionaceus]